MDRDDQYGFRDSGGSDDFHCAQEAKETVALDARCQQVAAVFVDYVVGRKNLTETRHIVSAMW